MWDAPFPSSLWLFVGLSPVHPCLSCAGEPWTEPNIPHVSHQCSLEGENHLPEPAGNALPNAAQEAAGLPCSRVLCWVMLNSVSTRTPKSFSATVLSSLLAARTGAWGCSFPGKGPAFLLNISSKLEEELIMANSYGADYNAVLSLIGEQRWLFDTSYIKYLYKILCFLRMCKWVIYKNIFMKGMKLERI